jgi:hypothetical protein
MEYSPPNERKRKAQRTAVVVRSREKDTAKFPII